MSYRFFTCDVFTDTRFGGNPLAVLPDASGLADEQMQQIAREFNYSETTFVLPAESGHTRRVRIFTPTEELPFAGHPNIGTAFVLAVTGEIDDRTTITFEVAAGIVEIELGREDERIVCELSAPEMLSFGKSVSTEAFAAAVSLAADDVVTATHSPQVVSTGLSFVFAELRDLDTLARARPILDAFETLRSATGVSPAVHLYTRAPERSRSASGTHEFDLHARMFAMHEGVFEDPATGSATCSLAGLLAHHDPEPSGTHRFRVAQGVEMGRPSVLLARAEKKDGVVVSTHVGGSSVMVSEGSIEVD